MVTKTKLLFVPAEIQWTGVHAAIICAAIQQSGGSVLGWCR